MKNSNFIADSVFKTNYKYTILQNKTKELFFKCLDGNKDYEYFKTELEKIWGKDNERYFEDELNEYEALIHERNTGVKETPKTSGIFKLVPIAVIMGVNKKFQLQKEREYRNSLNSYAYKNDKQEYLKQKVSRYTDQIVPYYSKTTGELIRYVELSTYDAMIHNTNLTRSGWNVTLNDGDEDQLFYIPFHSFSCPHCMEHQNKVMTKKQVIDLIGIDEETEGDILHPNCKCELTFYNGKLNKPKYSQGELEEQYNIRQKTNSLTLKKEKVLTDMRIQESLGNQDEVDKLNQQRNKINSEIRELKSQLPTSELQKQVGVINR
jgi:hypothetical protein